MTAGGLLLHSPKWRNFHDFLLDYIKHPSVLGGGWANLELKKPQGQRHPLMDWFQDVTRHLNRHLEVQEPAPMTSLCFAYLGLAYNLYLISHNNGKVHERLLHRLKDPKQFYGAFNETRINGMMIRSGFDIELEDESDVSTSHCEFTATHRATGQKLSVEAKFRESIRHPPAIGRQFIGALKKRALHQRLIVIEVNDLITPPDEQPAMLKTLLAAVRAREPQLVFDGRPADPTYLLFTNDPPGTTDRPRVPAYLVEGFKMDDFRTEALYPSLRAALDARDRHPAIEALIEGLRKHDRIPRSFDGEPSAYASNPPNGRLVIGQRYRMPGPHGEVEDELKFGFVQREQKVALCVLCGEDGSNTIVSAPLTDQELQAYDESPDTFFGRYLEPTKADHPIEFYDRLVRMYRDASKERMLALLAPMKLTHLGDLSAWPQAKLVELYAEKLVEWIWSDAQRKKAQAPAPEAALQPPASDERAAGTNDLPA